ncbi:hypothetical protein ES705_26653 [subsurface metagenome]
MKVEFKKDEERITNINLIAENDGDKALLEFLWWKDIKRKYLIYRGDEVRLESEISEFDRRG